jgi:hypothetical protein
MHRLARTTNNDSTDRDRFVVDRVPVAGDGAWQKACSMSWWRRLAKNRLLDVAALWIAALCVIKIAAMLPNQMREHDFAHFYVWGRVVLEGGNPYTTPLAMRYTQYGFVFQEESPTATYPPTFLRLFAPLTRLPAPHAFAVWVFVQAASLAVILWLTRRLLAPSLSARGWRFVCAGAVASSAVYYHFAASQIQLPLAALVLAAYAWTRAGRHAAACLAVTAAGLVKLFPFVLLPWFVWRSSENIRGRLGQASLAAGVSVAVVIVSGIGWWQDFFRSAAPVVKYWAMHHLFNYTIASFVLHIGYASHGFATEFPGMNVWWRVGLGTGVVVIAMAYLLCLRSTADCEAQFCLLCVALLAGCGKTLENYFVFLIFPVAAAAVRVAAKPSGGKIIWFALLLIALNDLNTADAPFLDEHLYLKVLLNYVPLYGLISLAIFFANELWRKSEPIAPGHSAGLQPN